MASRRVTAPLRSLKSAAGSTPPLALDACPRRLPSCGGSGALLCLGAPSRPRALSYAPGHPRAYPRAYPNAYPRAPPSRGRSTPELAAGHNAVRGGPCPTPRQAPPSHQCTARVVPRGRAARRPPAALTRRAHSLPMPMPGTIALSNAGPLPPDVEVPGRIIYFDQSGGSVGVDSFAFPGVDDIDLTPGRPPHFSHAALTLTPTLTFPPAGRCHASPSPLTPTPTPTPSPNRAPTLPILAAGRGQRTEPAAPERLHPWSQLVLQGQARTGGGRRRADECSGGRRGGRG